MRPPVPPTEGAGLLFASRPQASRGGRGRRPPAHDMAAARTQNGGRRLTARPVPAPAPAPCSGRRGPCSGSCSAPRRHVGPAVPRRSVPRRSAARPAVPPPRGSRGPSAIAWCTPARWAGAGGRSVRAAAGRAEVNGSSRRKVPGPGWVSAGAWSSGAR